uniref:Uncharacterized protein n=1 Tax=Vespula pensylvanica TaxID=30213 RepID=A0A834P6X2_VESPE|nr:hypothetical protein H0235_006487 [Vespula pensylvanica]
MRKEKQRIVCVSERNRRDDRNIASIFGKSVRKDERDKWKQRKEKGWAAASSSRFQTSVSGRGGEEGGDVGYQIGPHTEQRRDARGMRTSPRARALRTTHVTHVGF